MMLAVLDVGKYSSNSFTGIVYSDSGRLESSCSRSVIQSIQQKGTALVRYQSENLRGDIYDESDPQK